jgi:uroporphyrin-III C-methyltransferase/precorrin-2 dehydrogenase/sirohydrochlorin ferrochelatase
MEFLPVFLNIRNQPCVVIGGGDVAARKTEMLLRAGAKVTVVAPRLCETLQRGLRAGELQHLATEFMPVHLHNSALVIAATDDAAVNRRVSETARARHIPVNVVDQPELCSFVMPSIIDRSPVMVAVSSGGASPVLARLLRARLETLIPAAYGHLATLVQGFRDRVKQRFTTIDERRRFWEAVLQGPIAEMMYAGREQQARDALTQAVDQGTGASTEAGEVYLVGAGPGDPDLLTFRALRLLQQADVIVYDRLVSKEILDLGRRDAERIYVGKERDAHTLPQDDINLLLARLAKEGKRVLRLKGGDPFIFGRGGEEIETLAQQGIPFQIVPGITAAAGCASYAGIPLTHRDYAQSVVFATGHLRDGSVNLNWPALVQTQQTVVFYMGLKGMAEIFAELVRHGMSPDMPVALVEQGTTPRQRVWIGTLRSLPDNLRHEDVHAPTLIIVGEVVKLHDKLKWFAPVLK